MIILNDKTKIAVVALIIGQIFWGTSYILTELALRVFPPAMLVSIRLIIAALVLGSIAWATGNLVRIPWRVYRWFFLASFCEPFLYFLCEAFAVQRVGSMVTSVILSFIPLLTPFLTYFFIREKITIMSLIGIVVSTIGVLMVIVERGKFTADFLGIFFLFIAMFGAIGYALVIRKVPDEYNTLSVVFYMFCTALVFFIPTTLLTETDQLRALADVPSQRIVDALINVALLAVTSSCIAFLFYSYGVRIIGPNKAAVFNNIQPAITALFVWLLSLFAFESNPMTLVKWIGIFVVIIGMFISQKK